MDDEGCWSRRTVSSTWSLIDGMVLHQSAWCSRTSGPGTAAYRLDQASRTPITTEGPPLDTREVCPDLSLIEQARLRDLLAAERHRLGPEAAKVRAEYIAQQAERIVQRTGCTLDAARTASERQCGGVLPALTWSCLSTCRNSRRCHRRRHAGQPRPLRGCRSVGTIEEGRRYCQLVKADQIVFTLIERHAVDQQLRPRA